MIAIDHQDMTVALGLLAPLDRRVTRDRVRSGVALIGVLELHRDCRLRSRHDHVGNATGISLVDGAEVRVQRLVEPDPLEDSLRKRVDRTARDILIPRVVPRKHLIPAQARASSEHPVIRRLFRGSRHCPRKKQPGTNTRQHPGLERSSRDLGKAHHVYLLL